MSSAFFLLKKDRKTLYLNVLLLLFVLMDFICGLVLMHLHRINQLFGEYFFSWITITSTSAKVIYYLHLKSIQHLFYLFYDDRKLCNCVNAFFGQRNHHLYYNRRLVFIGFTSNTESSHSGMVISRQNNPPLKLSQPS